MGFRKFFGKVGGGGKKFFKGSWYVGKKIFEGYGLIFKGVKKLHSFTVKESKRMEEDFKVNKVKLFKPRALKTVKELTRFLKTANIDGEKIFLLENELRNKINQGEITSPEQFNLYLLTRFKEEKPEETLIEGYEKPSIHEKILEFMNNKNSKAKKINLEKIKQINWGKPLKLVKNIKFKKLNLRGKKNNKLESGV